MKNFLFVLAILSLVSCSHRIVRHGYQTDKSAYKSCDVIINKNIAVNDSLQKVGEIVLGETGFSTSCSEAHAIEILTNEACAIDAHVINITEEKRPDLWSSCYRCTAEFYQYKSDMTPLRSDEYYKAEHVNTRVEQDRQQNTVVTIIAVVAGFVLGYALFQ